MHCWVDHKSLILMLNKKKKMMMKTLTVNQKFQLIEKVIKTLNIVIKDCIRKNHFKKKYFCYYYFYINIMIKLF